MGKLFVEHTIVSTGTGHKSRDFRRLPLLSDHRGLAFQAATRLAR